MCMFLGVCRFLLLNLNLRSHYVHIVIKVCLWRDNHARTVHYTGTCLLNELTIYSEIHSCIILSHATLFLNVQNTICSVVVLWRNLWVGNFVKCNLESCTCTIQITPSIIFPNRVFMAVRKFSARENCDENTWDFPYRVWTECGSAPVRISKCNVFSTVNGKILTAQCALL